MKKTHFLFPFSLESNLILECIIFERKKRKQLLIFEFLPMLCKLFIDSLVYIVYIQQTVQKYIFYTFATLVIQNPQEQFLFTGQEKLSQNQQGLEWEFKPPTSMFFLLCAFFLFQDTWTMPPNSAKLCLICDPQSAVTSPGQSQLGPGRFTGW